MPTYDIRDDLSHETPCDDIVVEVDLRPLLHFVAIVAGTIGFAALYGIAHDLVTAHLCVEYFTIGHPRIVDSENPIVLALVWGIVATWWVGTILGVLLAVACRVGKGPKRTIRDVAPSIGKVLGVMAVCATVTGIAGYLLTRAGMLTFPMYFLKLLPPETYARFAADLWAHSASYAAGAIGGLIVIWRVWHLRRSHAHIIHGDFG